MSLATALALLGLITSPAVAFWRLPCESPIVVERADPVLSPGQVSNHLHTIMGGNGFDFTMDYNSTQQSTCSSCTVTGDNSNYWTPTLYYQAEDGTFESVDQVGGATVYYLQRKGDGETLKAFPPGFRMLAGNPYKRAPGSDFASQAISYNCLDYGSPPKEETGGFPNYNCPNGLRAQVFFPSCWNGRDLDSPDHHSHVSYPANSYNSGSCPPDFPVHLVSIFYEIIWDTSKFANRWYGNKQPFVWSMGDPTGYGGHGDFINGWTGDLLQRAVDTCTADSGLVEDCPVFSLIPGAQAKGCRVPNKVNEPTTGKLNALPGCNPIQAGPGLATQQENCGATTTISNVGTASFFTDLTSQGWAYTGCGTDSIFARVLTGASTSGDDMTNQKCVQFCGNAGFSIAATEFGRECYCGNSLPASAAPIPGLVGNCKVPCAGDASQTCGAAGSITIYTKCTGGSCTNVQIGPVIQNAVAVPNTLTQVDTAASTPSTSTGSTSYIPPGWFYVGCFTDTVLPQRSLSHWSTFNGPTMTNQACMNFCQKEGFFISGTEYGGECFCGNTLENSQQVPETDCDYKCKGDGSQICGGKARLSLYGNPSMIPTKRSYPGPRRVGRNWRT